LDVLPVTLCVEHESSQDVLTDKLRDPLDDDTNLILILPVYMILHMYLIDFFAICSNFNCEQHKVMNIYLMLYYVLNGAIIIGNESSTLK